MEIIKNKTDNNLTIELIGRLDTTTAPQLEKVVNDDLTGVDYLVYDFKKLEYISSAGLRLLLASQKIMNKQGKMEILNANESIKEIFEITGFIDFLTII